MGLKCDGTGVPPRYVFEAGILHPTGVHHEEPDPYRNRYSPAILLFDRRACKPTGAGTARLLAQRRRRGRGWGRFPDHGRRWRRRAASGQRLRGPLAGRGATGDSVFAGVKAISSAR